MNSWPVQTLNHTIEEDKDGKQPEEPEKQEPEQTQQRRMARRADSTNDTSGGATKGLKASWNHVMTQIDKLHKKGFRGSGIQIAVLDTGVDYNHPALGGCFGKGCKVVLGASLVPNDGDPNDPMDRHGHGTKVAGILAGYDEKDNRFVGAAPNATLAVYRVIKGNKQVEEDTLAAGWVRAYDEGAKIIVSSTGFPGFSWPYSLAATVVSRIVEKGIPCVVAIGNTGYAPFDVLNPAAGRGVTAVGAPGNSVPVPLKRGGYMNDSGTSFACPLVGGIMALIAEARGTFDPAEINSLLMANAAPQVEQSQVTGPKGLFTVMQQGGGLVQAWNAAHAATLVKPGSLHFNDTDHRPSSISLEIQNTAKSEVVYELSNIAADTMYTLDGEKFERKQHPHRRIQAEAAINFSKSSVTIGPGQSATIDVSASDPQGVDSKRLPLWSGWVAVNGSDGTSLTVPYLGLAGSLLSTSNSQDLAPSTRGEAPPVPQADGCVTSPPNLVTYAKPGIALNFLLASPQVDVYIVPLNVCPADHSQEPAPAASNQTDSSPSTGACVPESMITDIKGIKTIGQVPGRSKRYAEGASGLCGMARSLPARTLLPAGISLLLAS
ncbi:subtilase family domain-containing protein [Hirsutella rhossiliensis]|uniref:Subtilase family domain-containing protein n=1 Tax=Hirsutella rhossiliensis TaxID=111463 RepID=A0A9P8SHZ0_9HYPO|nr:subtilase family domain-containing protein [Hirsutella rhossiliensis]KAH0963648.1 subtilase family domain-containing protein [Hirsutella rhossiliensis]